ncbi:MobH family relaxase, partial [Serratia ficaria]|uniref:MobH family relaxase n=1 Tax=Serratia ficaria TaxID=61651 RepID=UPI0021B72F2A
MFALFQRKRPVQAATTAPATATKAKGLMRPEPAASLLATSRRQKLLEHIWQRTSLSRQQFAALYLAPLERYAELVQQFPASESHHHAYPGGLLDHGLEIVAYALKLRQSHLLPAGTTPEDQAAQAEAWTAATAYAALLHDIGKIAVDLHVEMSDGSVWHPWHGPLQHPYRFRYRKDREYHLHSAASGLLYNRLLDRDILDWLSGYRELWAALLYVLAGQYEHAGVLGELVTQADRASVAQELGGDPAKAMAAPKHALQRKLLEGLRYLLKEELKLNQPQASDGWLTQDALWLVSKTVSDKLRAHLLSQGIEGIPANNTAVFNILQDHGMLQATPDDKAIWKAVVTSDSGWTHMFTLLRLAPALIWEGNERPPAFQGTVEVVKDDTVTEDASPPPCQDSCRLELKNFRGPETTKMNTYSPERKAALIARMMPPHNQSVVQLA